MEVDRTRILPAHASLDLKDRAFHSIYSRHILLRIYFAEDDGIVANEWTAEMEAKFEELKKDLTDVIKSEIQGAEERLSVRLENRLSAQFKVAVEEMKDQVKLLGEAFGGTLEAIRRDISDLDRSVHSTLELHRQVLSEHSRDIQSLKRRLPQ